jgi:hypothetical protein
VIGTGHALGVAHGREADRLARAHVEHLDAITGGKPSAVITFHPDPSWTIWAQPAHWSQTLSHRHRSAAGSAAAVPAAEPVDAESAESEPAVVGPTGARVW